MGIANDPKTTGRDNREDKRAQEGGPKLPHAKEDGRGREGDAPPLRFPKAFEKGTPERMILENSLRNNPEVAQITANTRQVEIQGRTFNQLQVSAIGHNGNVLASEESSANRPEEAIEALNRKLDDKGDKFIQRKVAASLAAKGQAPASVQSNLAQDSPELFQVQNAMKNNPEIAQVVSRNFTQSMEVRGEMLHFDRTAITAIGHNGKVLASADGPASSPEDAIFEINRELDKKNERTSRRAEASLAAKDQPPASAETNFAPGSQEFIQLQNALRNNPDVFQVMAKESVVEVDLGRGLEQFPQLELKAYDQNGKRLASVEGSARDPHEVIAKLDRKLDKR